VLASAAAVATVTCAVATIPASMAFVFEAVLASTDPVAVWHGRPATAGSSTTIGGDGTRA
jgi:hypothetical protein